MHNFKVGDKVKCVSKNCDGITFNETYEITYISEDDSDGFYVKGEREVIGYYFSFRFVLNHVAIRDNIIKEILS